MYLYNIPFMCLTYICINRYYTSDVASWVVLSPFFLRRPFSHNGRLCTCDKSTWTAITYTLWIMLRFLLWSSVLHPLCYHGLCDNEIEWCISGFVQDCSISSALTRQILQSCTKQSVELCATYDSCHNYLYFMQYAMILDTLIGTSCITLRFLMWLSLIYAIH